MLPPPYAERPAQRADLEDVAAVVIAADIDQLGEPDWSVDDQAEEWADPRLDLATDTRVVLDAAGAVVGYAHVLRRDEGTDFDTETYVLPEHDGHGIEEHLLGFVEERARQGVAPGASSARLVAFCLETDAVRAARLRAAGYGVIRQFFRMTVKPPPEVLPEPNQARIRSADGPGDLATVHRVITEAFRGHFRSVALPFEEWEQRHLARADDGAPMLLAEL
ncbi:MAG TPA: GNAT family N-acetyltransferase, partial [Mycobacteriales bacterium]|nr:GNAT family N-acetyltransferase [Mycobacteriales bacterium]